MPVLRRLVLLLSIALAAASCSSADTLATVNDTAVTRDQLTALRPSYDDPMSVGAQQLRDDLGLLIIVEALQFAAADEFGVELTEADVANRLANPPERYAGILAPPPEGADVTGAAVRTSAIQTLLWDAVVPRLVAAEHGSLESILTDTPQAVTRVCVRHISVASAEDGNAVMDRLAAGEEFEALAAELSLDQVSPGGLVLNNSGECLDWPTGAAEELAYLAATAPLNEPVGPVASGDNWEVFVVEDRLAPASLADLEADPLEYLARGYIGDLYTPWANNAIRTASIDVSPTVGRWSDVGLGIAAPGE
ncbi:MAG: hypothetical protein QNJ77_05125 [Acidimicrobiia bacterium]|nr:hypothetical protein [Acidimicrobiia bacterium]